MKRPGSSSSATGIRTNQNTFAGTKRHFAARMQDRAVHDRRSSLSLSCVGNGEMQVRHNGMTLQLQLALMGVCRCPDAGTTMTVVNTSEK